jgi:hypothetical protein
MITSYREQTIELERQRLQYMRCNTMVDTFLVCCIVIITLGIVAYFIFITMKGKTVSIS